MKKIVVTILILMCFMTACGSINNNNKSVEENPLIDLSYGILYFHKTSTPEIVTTAVKELGKELNITTILINTDDRDSKNWIQEYLEENAEIVANYKSIKQLENKLNTGDQKIDNDTLLNYKKALNLIKNKENTKEQDIELNKIKEEIITITAIQRMELDQLLQLQKEPRVKVPYFSDIDNDGAAERLPMLKFIYNRNVQKIINLYEIQEYESKNDLIKYLKSAWYNNFTNSNEGDNLKNKLDNKDSFELFVMGNSCVHCLKVMPIINELINNDVPIEKIDMYNSVNHQTFYEIVKDKKYNIQEVKWYPSIIAIKNGIQIDSITVYDWSITNFSAELGYDINKEIISDFILKYAENEPEV